MAQDFFDQAPRLAAEEKYFDVSKQGLRRALLSNHGKCDLLTDHEVSVDGRPQTVVLRLNISTRGPQPTAWSMAVKLHGIRIDGVDHEGRFTTEDGKTAVGWHRHCWDPIEESAERHKVPVSVMDDIKTVEDFLVRGLSLLRVRLNAVDLDQELRFA